MIVITIIAVITFFLILGCIKSKRAFFKAFLGLTGLIGALVCCLMAGFVYVTRYKITDVDSRKSPDGRYELFLQEVGEPDWPFGYTHARLLLKDDGKIVNRYRFDVADDGGRMSAGQWTASWNPNGAEIVVCGEEQMDRLIILGYNGEQESRQLDTMFGQTMGKHPEENSFEISESNDTASGKADEPAVDTLDNRKTKLDRDGYPLSDEWQEYKNEMEMIAHEIQDDLNFEIEYHLTAKGTPYAVISREKDDHGDNTTERHLILNENYYSDNCHEYVLEECYFNQDGSEALDPKIIDFYLIDCTSQIITDEQTSQWH